MPDRAAPLSSHDNLANETEWTQAKRLNARMNAVEIEEAVSELAGRPFNAAEFPYEFLAAFDNKETTIKKLRSGTTNSSDIPNGVLQRNNIHIAVCPSGSVGKTIIALRESPKTVAAKAKYVLATDGVMFEAEDLTTSEHFACAYEDFAKHFGFFLPLARISTVKEIKNNPFDIKATGRLNKLYVELLKDNPDWATDAKRPALNQFIARLIFCFFAEDTGIFLPKQFTKTLEQMSDSQSGNTHEVLCELFRAMDLKPEDREAAKVRNWANVFPYVNGGMFAGGGDCPRFSRIARSYLLAVGNLEWDKINPDIFGSMIQAIAEDSERNELGLHYTSVPNILKVLNPLFLNDLREHLEAAGDNTRKLRNLRKRLSNIRVFDPACGSGNFLVIAYKQMRAIENEIVRRLKDDPKSWIKLENFYGVELKPFAVEIARLSLLIAEFQSDVQYISQQEARAMVLPLHRTGQIRTGNALRIDWLDACPPLKHRVVAEHDLGGPTGRLALESSELESRVETFVCGNPPYKGSQGQTEEQKNDMRLAFENTDISSGAADYVLGWFVKASAMARQYGCSYAFVATNSIHQGRQVGRYWPHLLGNDLEIYFAEPSFRWKNLASNKATVTVSVIGVRPRKSGSKTIIDGDLAREVSVIGPYLVPDHTVVVDERRDPISNLFVMKFGSMPNDGGHLLLEFDEAEVLRSVGSIAPNIRNFVGTNELTKGILRYCLWFESEDEPALLEPEVQNRISEVRKMRSGSKRPTTKALARTAWRFGEVRQTGRESCIVVGGVSSENREYLPVDILSKGSIISNLAYGLFDAPLWHFSIVASRLHQAWIATVCGKLETRYRYSNTLGWNTFPLPALSEQNKSDLSKCAEDILLARAASFPMSIAELYEPEDMPDDLRRAHEANDEVIERIYVGRRFKNDTERLEKLFELYSTMAGGQPKSLKKAKRIA